MNWLIVGHGRVGTAVACGQDDSNLVSFFSYPPARKLCALSTYFNGNRIDDCVHNKGFRSPHYHDHHAPPTPSLSLSPPLTFRSPLPLPPPNLLNQVD